MEVIHTALWVEDLEATEAFYVDALGLEQTWGFVGSDGATNVYVGGGDGAEVQFKSHPDRSVPAPTGFDHVAVSVEDTDATLERMVEETGCRVVRGPFQNEEIGLRVGFIEDPDGYVVELVQELE